MTTVDSRPKSKLSRLRSSVTTDPFVPARTGVLGTILTELEFGEDEQMALAELRDTIDTKLEILSEQLSTRGRQSALESEGLTTVDILGSGTRVRPSIRRVRRHACLQWLRATLSGRYTTQFSHQVRNIWIPILLAERDFDRAVPAVIDSFLSYTEGVLTAWIASTPAENFVPAYRQVHAIHVALEVQRRLLGITSP